METTDTAITGTIELINRLHQKLTIPVKSSADALAKQRALGEQGWAPAQVPDGGYFFPISMAGNFDFRLIGGRYFEFKKKNRNDREVTVKCIEHLGHIYTCRDLPEEEGGQEKGAKVKYSRGGKPTDRPHIKEGAGGDKPGYVTLITFAGAGRSIREYEVPRANGQSTQRRDTTQADRPAAEAHAPAAAQTQPAPAPANAAPAPAAAADAPPVETAAPAPAAPTRALASVPPKVDLQARWNALGRKRDELVPWLHDLGVTLTRGVEPTDDQKVTIHNALLKLETKTPSPLERWKALGEDPKAFVGWLTSLGIAIPAQGYFDPATMARIGAALSDLEAQAAEAAEYESAAQ